METLKFWTDKYDFQSSYCNIVNKTLLYNNVYEYHILSKIGCDNIRGVIEKVKLSPLFYNVKFSETESTNFENIIEILKHILLETQNLEISEIEISIQDDGSWNFTPYLKLQNDILSNIYLDPNHPIFDLDLYPLRLFKYLSDSELTLYAHQNSSIPESILINLFGVYIIQKKYEIIIPEIQSAIVKYEKDRYKVLNNLQNFETFRSFWNIIQIQDQIYQTDFEPEWIYNALIDIKKGELPIYQLTGNWQFHIAKTQKNMAFLYYTFLKFYCKQIIINPVLLNYISEIKILPDLSITARFGRYEETKGFNPMIYNLNGLECNSFSEILNLKLELDSQNKIVSIVKEFSGKYWMIWEGSLNSKVKINTKNLLVTSKDKILLNIISGTNIEYRKLYLSGILSTDITSGFLNLEDLKNIGSTLTPWEITQSIYNIREATQDVIIP